MASTYDQPSPITFKADTTVVPSAYKEPSPHAVFIDTQTVQTTYLEPTPLDAAKHHGGH